MHDLPHLSFTKNVANSPYLAKEDLAVALATADDAPRVVVDNWEVLLASWSKGVIEIVTEPSRLLPGVLRIAKKHAQKMTSAGLAIVATICLASMHNA
jgi:hypothetical protein